MKIIYKIILDRIRAKKSIEEAILFFRTLGFYFITMENFQEIYKGLSINEKYRAYSVMIRPELKNKQQMVFYIKLIGKKTNKIITYTDDVAPPKIIRLSWKVQRNVNFKKMTIHWTFPNYMTHKQRREWRAEHMRLLKDPNKKPTQYYRDCLPDVTFLKPIEIRKKNG